MATIAEVKLASEVINQEWPEGTDVSVVARAVIDAIRKSDKDAAKKLAVKEEAEFRKLSKLPEVRTVFKTPFSNVNYFVVWTGKQDPLGPDYMFAVEATSNYGWLAPVPSTLMRIHALSNVAESTIDKVLNSTLGLVPGDKLSFRQSLQFTVEAVFSRGALLRERRHGFLYVEENDSLKKFYTDGWVK